MQTYETRIVQKEEKFNYKNWCDWCEEEIKDKCGYEVDDFELSWRTGESYGSDGGWGYRITS